MTKKSSNKSWISLWFIMAFVLFSAISGCAARPQTDSNPATPQSVQTTAHSETWENDEQGSYDTAEEVARYLHTYGHLPDNYITKKEAEKLGWDNKQGNLSDVAPGKSIGGSHYGNYEKTLPDADGRKYYECDLEYKGGYRGAKRLVYSNDGLIFYTEDHYKTFTQLY